MSSNIQITRVCKHCGNEFTARTTVTQYCSDSCSKRAYKARIRAGKIEASNSETQRVRNKPVEDLKEKDFLTVTQVSKLIGCSRQNVYKLINTGRLKATNILLKKTIVRRADLNQLFEKPKPVITEQQQPVEFVETECYNVADVREKYSISQTALRNLILKHNIPTFYKGWFAYVPKAYIDKLLSTPQTA